jgi:hypothetical protein
MSDESAAPAVKNPARLPSANILPRAAGLIEVVAAFALVHVTYRSFNHLREKTRSILAGAVFHGLTDVMATVPGMLG